MRIRLSRPIEITHLAQHTQAQLHEAVGTHSKYILYLTTDSREVEPGDLFVAISIASKFKSAYIDQAIERGAIALLIDSPSQLRKNVHTLLVKRVLTALSLLAKWNLTQIHPRVVAITGSVGKTTTRHLVSSLLTTTYRVHESPHNYNNLLGTCLTILSMPFDTEYLVAECGMDGSGQISELSRLLEPDAAIITNVGLAHIEKLGSTDAICNAKLEIRDGMRGGVVFYPAESSLLSSRLSKNAVPVFSEKNDQYPYVTNIEIRQDGTHFDYVSCHHYLKDVRIPAFGMHIALCARLALALAEREGVDSQSIYIGSANFEAVDNRQKIHSFPHLTIIDDSYNASPDSMLSALSTMSYIAAHKKAPLRVAVLGDMLELGEYATKSHQKVGEKVCGICTHLVAIGKYAQEYAKGAKSAGMRKELIFLIPVVTPTGDLMKKLYQLVQNTPSVILFKGSHGTPLSYFAQEFIHMLSTQ